MEPIRELKLLELLHDDPSIILLFKRKETTENMWKVAIENEPALFQYMKDPSEEMIYLALREDGANIRYLKEMGIEITPKMIYIALKNYPGAVFLLPKQYQTQSVKEFACSGDPTLIRDLELNKDFIDRLLRRDPALARFLKHPTEEQLCRALEVNSGMCAYIENFTPKMKEIIISKYPDLIPLIPRLRDNL